jgi:protein SCO1/2
VRGGLGVALLALSACGGSPPAKQYELKGQVLAVYDDRQELAIKHEDIVGFMPGMTMSFPVATKAMMEGRAPGELITATLEVQALVGRIVAITHVGTAPLPDDTNTVAMIDGILQVGDAVPDVALIDQQNRRRSLSEWTGGPFLLTFIYTRCPLPNFCPAMNRNFASIQRSVAADPALRGRVQLLSVSFDPEHDTPTVLADFAAKHDSDPAVWTWLTGDRITTDRLAARFGVSVIRNDGSAADVTHNLQTILVDAGGHVSKIYSGTNWTTDAVLADLRDITK